MPIYSDYHGDFQNSTNSSWDQIQASLKILLLSYQPLPSDSLDELSFLSFQKQKRIRAEIKKICNKIYATLNEMIQEEEQADADPDPKIQKSECEIGEGDAAMVQNAITITDPAPIQQSNSENLSEIHEDKFEKQEDEDELDVRSIYHGCFDRSATVVVARSPPEPPDLHSSSSAEDGVVAKGNVDSTEVDVGSADLTKGSSAAEKMWTATSKRTTATVANRCFWAQQLRRFVSLKLPPLMAAIFPWDRGRKRTDDGLQWQPEVSAEDKANATVVGEVGRQRGLAENGDSGATQWLAEQGLLLPSFGNREGGKRAPINDAGRSQHTSSSQRRPV
ncbi:hypothetical protein PIB30_018744 [Stylosanthes scabra]|uniref:Uncharacterized protein n=1 Tax=Stylosanthes scabra TaxID=79078 RepID=A0ABU6Z7I8_9FABA|nr:hypothetical protein [Stylosanthes scabra]